ncbi:hypothetical protein KOJCDNHJ_02492 [Xanthomonas citri pv. punicae]|nr:hypothetical protein FICKIIDM_04217 [Xanthomonas citri pv. punicae]UIS29089.1 hypothetical protein KOJCDNHJ_02492 [Xanthomonas citri pv. punicae]
MPEALQAWVSDACPYGRCAHAHVFASTMHRFAFRLGRLPGAA